MNQNFLKERKNNGDVPDIKTKELITTKCPSVSNTNK